MLKAMWCQMYGLARQRAHPQALGILRPTILLLHDGTSGERNEGKWLAASPVLFDNPCLKLGQQ